MTPIDLTFSCIAIVIFAGVVMWNVIVSDSPGPDSMIPSDQWDNITKKKKRAVLTFDDFCVAADEAERKNTLRQIESKVDTPKPIPESIPVIEKQLPPKVVDDLMVEISDGYFYPKKSRFLYFTDDDKFNNTTRHLESAKKFNTMEDALAHILVAEQVDLEYKTKLVSVDGSNGDFKILSTSNVRN